MKQNGIKIVSLSLTLLLAVACVKYDALPFGGQTLIRATEYGNDWLYYNAETEEQFEISEGEQKERLDWDIAFNRYNIRTNSGLSGNGKGGAVDMERISYADFKQESQLPESATFSIDELYEITMSKAEAIKKGLTWFDTNKGPITMASTANPVLSKAINFSGPPPVYTPTNHVYVFRTADGLHYYKLWIVSFFDTQGLSGKISFKCDKLEK